MRNKVRNWLRRVSFAAPWWSIPFNPSYLMRRPLRRWIARALAEQRGQCLDFGCGSAPYREAFPGTLYVGVEVPVSGHDHRDSRTSVYFDGEQLPFSDEAFSVVLASEVLEHVPDAGRALAEMARVLRTGGRLILTTPFLFPEHELPYDFRRFTENGLRGVLRQAGLTTERADRFGSPAHVLGQLWLRYAFEIARRLRMAALLTPLLCVMGNGTAALLAVVLPRHTGFYLGTGLVARKLRPEEQ